MSGNYSHTTRSTGTVLTASIYNSDHVNHITNATPAGLDDYSSTVTEMRATTDPGESGTESQPTSLAGELERIRNVLVEITGKTYWYETPGTSLAKSVPVLGTEQATTSGSSVEWTGIPSWVQRIQMMFEGVSTNDVNDMGIQLSTSGGYVTSGYDSMSALVSSTPSVSVNTSNSQFTIKRGSGASAHTGIITLSLKDATNHTWIVFGGVGYPGGTNYSTSTGSVTLTAALTALKLRTGDTFDAGSVNILYD